jgi:hypothetical protein
MMGDHPIVGIAMIRYTREVKNHPKRRIRVSSPGSFRAQRIHGLKQCIAELKALSIEAASILKDLLINRSRIVARELCTRFHLLQTYFSIRYREAQALALSVIGSLEMNRRPS